MGEIVYAHREEKRDDLPEYGRRPTDIKTTIFAGPNKVAVVTSTLVAGAVRNSTKHYWQWRTTSSYGFFRNRAGNLQPYHATRSWDGKGRDGKTWSHRVPDLAFGQLDRYKETSDEAYEVYRRAVSDNLGIKSIYDLYPMAREYGLIRYNTIPFELRVPMRETTWAGMATAAFGKTRASKRLTDAVANTDPYIVALAHQFRGLVDDERIVKFMEKTHFDEEMEEGFKPHHPRVRRVLKCLKKKDLNAILKNGLDLNDTVRIYHITHCVNHMIDAWSEPGVSYRSWHHIYPR